MADVLSELTPLELDGLRLRALRRRYNLTGLELCDAAGVTDIVGQIETATNFRRRNMSELEALAAVFHRPPADIFPGTVEYLNAGVATNYLSYETHPDEDVSLSRRGVQFA